jgi:hypothetical protein
MNTIRHVSCLFAILISQGLAQKTAEKPAPVSYLRQATVTEIAGMVRITANSPRPLLQVVDALQRKYGWVLGYEDPRYSPHLDVIDLPGDDSHARVPAGGEFIVEFPAGAPDQEKTLRHVVESYNETKNPGRFELRRTADNEFYIEGVAARDKMDAISAQHPLFDLPVTLATRERTIAGTLNQICREVALSGHTKVTLGVSPTNILTYTTVKIGGTRIAARELLLQCLKATHRNLYWRLLYNPTAKSYFLDIHSAQSPRASPTI